MLWWFNLEKEQPTPDVCGLHIGSWLECAEPPATYLPLDLRYTSIAEVAVNLPVYKCPSASERQGGLFQTYGMLNGSTWGCYFGPLPSTPLSWELWDIWQPFCCGSHGFFFVSDVLRRSGCDPRGFSGATPSMPCCSFCFFVFFREMQNLPEAWGEKQEVFQI